MFHSLLAQWRPLLHPMLVHFPIALLLSSVALDWIGYWFKLTNLTRAGFYTLVLGAMGAGLSALTGPDAVTGDPGVPALLASHQTFAALTVTLAVVLVAIRFLASRGMSGVSALAYLAATLFLVAFVSLTGYYGGEMAYHHAVGIAAPNVTHVAGTPQHVSALLPAKPITALLGFLCIVGLGFWLLLGRKVFPNAANAWWQALRQEWAIQSAPLWTLRRGPARSVAASLAPRPPAFQQPAGPRPTAQPIASGAHTEFGQPGHMPGGFGQPAQPSGYARGPRPPYGQPPYGQPAAPQPGQPSCGQPRYNPPHTPDNQPRR